MSNVQMMPLGTAEALHLVVASNVRAEAARLKVTQVAMAARLGISQQAMSGKLRGKTALTLDELDILAGMLGTTAAYLCARRDSNPRPSLYKAESSAMGKNPGSKCNVISLFNVPMKAQA